MRFIGKWMIRLLIVAGVVLFYHAYFRGNGDNKIEVDVSKAQKQESRPPKYDKKKMTWNHPKAVTENDLIKIVDLAVAAKEAEYDVVLVDYRAVLLGLAYKESGYNFPKDATNIVGKNGERGIFQIDPMHLDKYKNALGGKYNLDDPLQSALLAIDALWGLLERTAYNWQEAILLWSTRDGLDKVEKYRKDGLSGLSNEVQLVLASFEEAYKKAKQTFRSDLQIVFSESGSSTTVAKTPASAPPSSPNVTSQQKVTLGDLNKSKEALQNATRGLREFIEKEIEDREEAKKALTPAVKKLGNLLKKGQEEITKQLAEKKQELTWLSLKRQQTPVISAVDRNVWQEQLRQQISAEKQKEIDALNQQLELLQAERSDDLATIAELEDRIESPSGSEKTLNQEREDAAPTAQKIPFGRIKLYRLGKN